MAPDYLEDDHNAKVDVWDVVILAQECVELKMTCKSKNAFKPTAYNARCPPRIVGHGRSDTLCSFVQVACEANRVRSPTPEKLLEHSFFCQVCARSVPLSF